MANPYVIDFSGPQNALGHWSQQNMQRRKMEQEQGQFEQTNALARAQMARQSQQFGMSHSLAQRSVDRADALAPGELDLQKARLAHARSQGASEIELRPLMLELKQTELQLAKAKAEGKDAETQRFNQLFGDPPPPQAAPPPQQQPGYVPGVRPQSYNGAPQQPGMAPMPVVDAGGPRNALAPQQDDASLILTQGGAQQAPPQPQSQPNAQPGVREIIQKMTPAQKAQLMLSWTGKGDAAKVIGEAANVQNLGKEARNKVDEQELNAVNSVARLKQIASGYKDEWLTWEGQWKQYGAALIDKSSTLRSKMKPADVQALEEYTTFQRDAIDNLNLGIKEATGATMGVQEEGRIRKAMPDPEKDSPSQFKSKLIGALKAQELTIQRTQFLRQNGFTGDANAAAAKMPFERFDNLLKDSRSLYQKLKTENPGADERAIRDSVRQTIVRKYGIAA